MAGTITERQERSLIERINFYIETNNNSPIVVVAGSISLPGVSGAEKYRGRQLGGSEPYTDVILHTQKEGTPTKLNLSLKGESAPSLGGGGLRGINLILPGFSCLFMDLACKTLLNQYKIGDKIPNVYAKLSEECKTKILVGNEAVGGPIDYMYIGPMNVEGVFTHETQSLLLNGSLIDPVEYALSKDLFFRLRARREDQTFDPTAQNKTGMYRVYGRSPTKREIGGRLVVTDEVPSNALIVELG